MKAHIVGGGFGGLAAAAYLIRHAGVSGQDITVYEAGGQLGGAFLLAGSAATGYILPSGALFDSECRCTNDLLAAIHAYVCRGGLGAGTRCEARSCSPGMLSGAASRDTGSPVLPRRATPGPRRCW